MNWGLLATLGIGGALVYYFTRPIAAATPAGTPATPGPINYVPVPPSPYTTTLPARVPGTPGAICSYGPDCSPADLTCPEIMFTGRLDAAGKCQPLTIRAFPGDLHAALANPPTNFSSVVFSSGGGAGQM
jgi:hypothetical protein